MTYKQNWVCSLCGQTFTRNTSGKRHNLSLHLGMSQIVNFTDYCVGRLNGKYKSPDRPPVSFRRKKSLEANYLDVQDKKQENNPYNLITNLSDIKNNIFHDNYNDNFPPEYKDIFSFNNFFLDNAAIIDSVIEEYQKKLQPFLRIEEINQIIKAFIIIPR